MSNAKKIVKRVNSIIDRMNRGADSDLLVLRLSDGDHEGPRCGMSGEVSMSSGKPGLLMSSFFIFERNVLGCIARISAAPFSPLIFQWHRSMTAII